MLKSGQDVRFLKWIATTGNVDLLKLDSEKLSGRYFICAVHFAPEHKHGYQSRLTNIATDEHVSEGATLPNLSNISVNIVLEDMEEKVLNTITKNILNIITLSFKNCEICSINIQKIHHLLLPFFLFVKIVFPIFYMFKIFSHM